MGLISNRGKSGAPASAAPVVNTPERLLQRGHGTEKHLIAKEAHDKAQLKTFERWWNSELPDGSSLGDGGLAKAVSSGVPGILLLEQLTGTPFKSYNATPGDNRIKIIENQSIFLQRVRELGIQLTNISVEDLADGKQTLILGLTWKLIAHFSEGMLTDAGGADLQAWLRGNLHKYSPQVSVTSWSESLNDGMALCALLHSYDPHAIPNFSELTPDNAQANLDLAFTVAKDKYGCPRLLDAADLIEGTGDDDEKVDVRSLQTYVLKLRQALRRHAEKSLEEAAAKLEALEAEGAALVAWAEEAGSRLAAASSECTASRANASTPEERRKAMESADALHEALSSSFQKVEKAGKAAGKASLLEGVEQLRYVFSDEAKRFDHGMPLSVGGSLQAAPAEERLRGLTAKVDAAWTSLEQVEVSYEAALLSILTYKHTDLMLAAAETEAGALSTWASAQAAALKSACIDDVATVSSCVASSEALAAFASAVAAHGERTAALDAQLTTVATRRADEGREPAPTPWREELSVAWGAMLENAAAARRSVGAASKYQIAQAKLLAERWAEMEAPLAACLPADAELVGPPPPEGQACAIM